VIIHQQSMQIIATAFANGSSHDFRLFKESQTSMSYQLLCLAGADYQGLANLHTNTEHPRRSQSIIR